MINIPKRELCIFSVLCYRKQRTRKPVFLCVYDITAIFVIKKYHNNLKINDNESKELEWFKIDNLPENMTEYTKNYIKKFGDILEKALDEFKN